MKATICALALAVACLIVPGTATAAPSAVGLAAMASVTDVTVESPVHWGPFNGHSDCWALWDYPTTITVTAVCTDGYTQTD